MSKWRSWPITVMAVAWGLGCGWTGSTWGADWAQEIGYDALCERLGPNLPSGDCVRLSQVEAASGERSAYLPQEGKGDFEGKAAFAGKVFRALSDEGASSNHAKIVGHFLYGAEDMPGFGARSLSPGIGKIDVYRAGVRHYLSEDYLQTGKRREPLKEANDIQNHSWYGHKGSASPAYLNEVLRRLDFSIQRDDYVCVVALGNDPEEEIPPLMASAYNVLTVGCSSGEHSRGLTHPDLDGGGRSKPDLVAPLSATSFATPVVSSSAALLLDCAQERDPEAVLPSVALRAMLMAGASKGPFADWSRTTTRPFDPVFGAGQLDVNRSHRVLTEQRWEARSIKRGQKREVLFSSAREINDFSAVLAWNRSINMRRGEIDGVEMADMQLRLFRVDQGSLSQVLLQESDSRVENREHVFLEQLPAGHYVLEIQSDREVDYGLAWDYEIREAPELQWRGEWLVASGSVPQGAWLEYSSDLRAWQKLPAAHQLESGLHRWLPVRQQRDGYYRLAWASEDPLPVEP